MNKDFFFDTSRKSVWFIVQVVILIICLTYIEVIYYQNILPDQQVDDTFSQANCTVVNKKLEETGKLVQRYRADFLVSYLAQGKAYQSMTSANGLDRSFTSDRVSEEDELNQFNVGGVYSCWYNPEKPSVVVLVLRHSWSSTFPLFIPSVIAIIMIYYIFRTLFAAIGAATRKTRETIKNKRDKK